MNIQQRITETSQYLTFRLDEETFALDVRQAREVLDLTSITRMPGTPEFVRGVINVRGNVVPVVDLKVKFRFRQAVQQKKDASAKEDAESAGTKRLAAKTKTTKDTRIIVVELEMDKETVILGALADSVEEVIELTPEHIESTPKIATKWRTEYIKGIGKKNEQFIIILDMDKIFSTQELAFVEEAGVELDLDDSSSPDHSREENTSA